MYEGPLSFKEVMDKHAVTKPFWLTETGKEATYGDAAEERSAAPLLPPHPREMLKRPWWATTIFYEAFDEPPAPYTGARWSTTRQRPAGTAARACRAS